MLKKIEKVVAYIDGFNLYFGIRDQCPKLKWYNPVLLASNLLKPDQTLVGVNYYTARITNNADKELRQSMYLDAVGSTVANIIYGQYKSSQRTCVSCGTPWTKNEEKMTDVNIAVSMLLGAYHGEYDAALLISGDSDLVPAVNAIHATFPDKRVVVAFPPDRHNRSMEIAAKPSFIIGRGKIAASQFPPTVTLPNNIAIHKPVEWL